MLVSRPQADLPNPDTYVCDACITSTANSSRSLIRVSTISSVTMTPRDSPQTPNGSVRNNARVSTLTFSKPVTHERYITIPQSPLATPTQNGQPRTLTCGNYTTVHQMQLSETSSDTEHDSLSEENQKDSQQSIINLLNHDTAQHGIRMTDSELQSSVDVEEYRLQTEDVPKELLSSSGFSTSQESLTSNVTTASMWSGTKRRLSKIFKLKESIRNRQPESDRECMSDQEDDRAVEIETPSNQVSEKTSIREKSIRQSIRSRFSSLKRSKKSGGIKSEPVTASNSAVSLAGLDPALHTVVEHPKRTSVRDVAKQFEQGQNVDQESDFEGAVAIRRNILSNKESKKSMHSAAIYRHILPTTDVKSATYTELPMSDFECEPKPMQSVERTPVSEAVRESPATVSPPSDYQSETSQDTVKSAAEPTTPQPAASQEKTPVSNETTSTERRQRKRIPVPVPKTKRCKNLKFGTCRRLELLSREADVTGANAKGHRPPTPAIFQGNQHLFMNQRAATASSSSPSIPIRMEVRRCDCHSPMVHAGQLDGVVSQRKMSRVPSFSPIPEHFYFPGRSSQQETVFLSSLPTPQINFPEDVPTFNHSKSYNYAPLQNPPNYFSGKVDRRFSNDSIPANFYSVAHPLSTRGYRSHFAGTEADSMPLSEAINNGWEIYPDNRMHMIQERSSNSQSIRG